MSQGCQLAQPLFNLLKMLTKAVKVQRYIKSRWRRGLLFSNDMTTKKAQRTLIEKSELKESSGELLETSTVKKIINNKYIHK